MPAPDVAFRKTDFLREFCLYCALILEMYLTPHNPLLWVSSCDCLNFDLKHLSELLEDAIFNTYLHMQFQAPPQYRGEMSQWLSKNYPGHWFGRGHEAPCFRAWTISWLDSSGYSLGGGVWKLSPVSVQPIPESSFSFRTELCVPVHHSYSSYHLILYIKLSNKPWNWCLTGICQVNFGYILLTCYINDFCSVF
jgi:hypothetical protein